MSLSEILNEFNNSKIFKSVTSAKFDCYNSLYKYNVVRTWPRLKITFEIQAWKEKICHQTAYKSPIKLPFDYEIAFYLRGF